MKALSWIVKQGSWKIHLIFEPFTASVFAVSQSPVLSFETTLGCALKVHTQFLNHNDERSKLSVAGPFVVPRITFRIEGSQSKADGLRDEAAVYGLLPHGLSYPLTAFRCEPLLTDWRILFLRLLQTLQVGLFGTRLKLVLGLGL